MQDNELEWKCARVKMPFLRRWKTMTQNKANHAFWKIVRYYAQNVPLPVAVNQAHYEMRSLYNLIFDKTSLEWRDA